MDAGSSFGWYELELQHSIALGVARVAVLGFMALRLASDLNVPRGRLALLGLGVLILTVLGVLFAAPPQPVVVLQPAEEPLGQELYELHCASCHGLYARGGSASSLVDGEWAYGEHFDEVSLNIAAGIPEAGMPEFSSVVGAEQVPFVTAYVFELRAAEQQD